MTTEHPTFIRRDFIKPGDVIRSSHGYDLLITEVDDSAPVRTDERHVGFTGHLHADVTAPTRTERYPAGSLVQVVRFADALITVKLTPGDATLLNTVIGMTLAQMIEARKALGGLEPAVEQELDRLRAIRVQLLG